MINASTIDCKLVLNMISLTLMILLHMQNVFNKLK